VRTAGWSPEAIDFTPPLPATLLPAPVQDDESRVLLDGVSLGADASAAAIEMNVMMSRAQNAMLIPFPL
jgi:hypothetical protein